MIDKWTSPVDRICETCGGTFQVQYQSVAKGKGRHCKACKPSYNKGVFKSGLGHSHSKTSRSCLACGKLFETTVKNLSRGGGGYCSRVCNPKYAPVFGRREVERRANLKRNYGLTTAEYDEMHEHQGGVCGLCGEKPNGKRERLFVDHDHETGTVRKLLCTTCNVGLGMFNEDPELLARAIRYLGDHATAMKVEPNQAALI